ncbi:MAG TPA: dihydrofolate reductase family protein, partial [Devosia sp.]|nr:dihydrofolate reductase family protein [Devosia sp.]
YTSHAPSTASIAAAGIGRVVVGTLDPVRAGEGLAELAAAGIEAVHLPYLPSDVLNEGYLTRLVQGRPFVTLKITLTSQGMVGHARRGSPSLLGVEARRWLERERAASDAVMSGAARAEIEDNDLRVHLAGLDDRAAPRVILAGSRDLELDVELFRAVSGIPIMVLAAADRPLELRPGVEIVAVEGRRGRPDLRQSLALLAARGVSRLLVEAGARLAESFIAGELVDRLHVVDVAADIGRLGVPAALLGRFEDRIAAARFAEVDRRMLGEDKVRTFERS